MSEQYLKEIDELIEAIDKLSTEIDDYNERDFDESYLSDLLDINQSALLAKADDLLREEKKLKLSLVL